MKHFLTLVLMAFVLHSSAQKTLQHTSSKLNSSGNSTYLDDTELNSNPAAIVIVEMGAATKAANPHAIGVWYSGSKWAIYNQDKTAMPFGLSFSVKWKSPDANSFSSSAVGGTLALNHPSLNNNPNARFSITQAYNPGGKPGVYNNNDVAAEFNASDNKWYIKNINGSLLPEGASFNIIVENTTNVSNGIGGLIRQNASIPNASEVIAISKDVNLGFENGAFNWKATGNAFDNQPIEGNTVSSERVLRSMEYSAGGIGGDYWKNMMYPIGFKGNYWIGTYENSNGDAPTGTFTSIPFRATKKYLSFLLGGGRDMNKLYVELQVKKSDYEAAWGAARRTLWGETADGFVKVERAFCDFNSEELYRHYFDLGADLNGNFQDKAIRICIVDDKTTSWGHINVDDFTFKDDLGEYITIQRSGYSVLADSDKPLWGFADVHAHWVNHIGLNGLFHGKPGYKLEESDVRNDIPPCDGFNHNLPTITPGLLIAQVETGAMRRLPERLADPGNATCALIAAPSLLASIPMINIGGTIAQMDGAITGALIGLFFNSGFQACGYLFTKDVLAKHYGNTIPANNTPVNNYVDFPRWNSFFHQTMHISWVRRSYDGGQRLMVVPVGTAKSWEFNTTANGQMGNAKNLVEQAVTELKKIVNANSTWMGIATTPRMARELILNNKMAIVIGLEQAESGSYFESAQDEVNWLESLGIRHVFPIHNIDNKLGGAALFNSKLTSYNDLVNRLSADGPIKPFSVREGNTNDETRTNIKLERNFMRQNLRTIPIIGFGTIPFFFFNDVPGEYGYSRFTAHKNVLGFTAKGRDYLTALMQKGIIVDVDHMSDLSQQYAMEYMHRYNYPMIVGHANFRELRRESTETSGGDKEARLKTEFTIFDSRVKEISDAGGMFGVMTQQNNVRPSAGCPVPNNSAGGSSSFAQAYWYTLQKIGEGKGIAFGSDFNGFAPQTAPRFGVDAGTMLEGDDSLNRKIGNRNEDRLRRQQAFEQANGVKYDSKINKYHYHRFFKPAFLTSEEREIWEAIAIAKSGVQPTEAWQPGGGLSVERTGLQQDKIKNMAEGFRWGILREPTGDYSAFLECPGYIVRDENLNNCMPERKAAYMCVRGFNSVPEHMRSTRTIELYNIMNPIYQLWMQFENGPNEPLRRSFAYAGGRDFDFNLDGLAHYGLYPDMIQDLKNNGLNASQLRPLFLATEQYIEMWEKADAAKQNVH